MAVACNSGTVTVHPLPCGSLLGLVLPQPRVLSAPNCTQQKISTLVLALEDCLDRDKLPGGKRLLRYLGLGSSAPTALLTEEWVDGYDKRQKKKTCRGECGDF
jgi:hypothetical protein